MPPKQLDKPKEDLVNQKFGRLTVLEFKGWNKHRQAMYLVRCECSAEKVVNGSAMKSGSPASCGCLYVETRKTASKPRLLPGEHAFNSLYSSYRSRAKQQEYCFDLTKEQFKELTSKNCSYCGVAPYKDFKPDCESLANDRNKVRKKVYNGGYLFNGIDRIDSDIGYRLDNCQTCCEICNKAKRDLTEEDFKQWIQRLINHQLNLSVLPLM